MLALRDLWRIQWQSLAEPLSGDTYHSFSIRDRHCDSPCCNMTFRYCFHIIKIIVRSFGSSKNTKLEDGPYCTISGNEPSSVTLYKTGSESQTFCCNFKNLHLCSLNQRLKFPKGPNNQNTVKKMILNV